MFKKFLLATSLLVLSLASHAGLISHYGYERDDTSDIVTGNGLEWLQWDVTVGMSIESALESYSIDGWKLASNQQMADLFNAFGFGAPFDDRENLNQGATSPWSPSESSPHNAFLDLFGVTRMPDVCSPSHPSNCYVPTDPLTITAAFYGSDDNNNAQYKYAAVWDDYSIRTTIETRLFSPNASLLPDEFHLVSYSPASGVALVREVLLPVHNVSEPYTFSLLAFALIALGFRRRQALRR